MTKHEASAGGKEGEKQSLAANVKSSKKYSRFGEIIRYLTLKEYQKFIDGIDNRKHRLMFELIYELGCRVGEFVRIRLQDIDFSRGMVYFPAENTKTRQPRWSFLSKRQLNEIKALLKDQGRMTKRTDAIRQPHGFLFHPGNSGNLPYSENRIRQVFRECANKAGLNRHYGEDTQGRSLHQFSVHSLRHSHIMHYVHEYKLPLPIVQKQVGHKTLKATSVYLNPSEHLVAQSYSQAQPLRAPHMLPPQQGVNQRFETNDAQY